MFKAIGRFFKSMFKNTAAIFTNFISFVFTNGLDIFIAEFKDVAMQIVESLESGDFSNDEKRDIAFNNIKSIVETKGKYYENNYRKISK